MSQKIDHVLAVWLKDEPDERISVWIENVLILSKALTAPVHFSAPTDLKERFDLLLREKMETGESAPHLATYQDATLAEDTLTYARDVGACAIVLPRGKALWSSEARKLTCASTLPVMYLPLQRKLPDPPFTNLMVPLSAEEGESQALKIGLELAETFDLPVDVVHVTTMEPEKSRDEFLAPEIDQMQHEYPGNVHALLTQSDPFASPHLLQRVRSFEHYMGEISEGVERAVQNCRECLLLLEWSGSLDAGRAKIIKTLMSHLDTPVAIVKPKPGQKATLKVGRQFDPHARKQIRDSFPSERRESCA